MKKYFYTYKEEDYEADDPLEVADWILSNVEEHEDLKDKVLKAIASEMVNEIEDDDYLAEVYHFHEVLDKLKQMNIRSEE